MHADADKEDPAPSLVLPSGFQVELHRGDQRLTMVEVGAGIRSYKIGNWQVFDGYGEHEMCTAARGQPLIPWPNRLRDGTYSFQGVRHQLALTEPERHNAIHGLVRWANWSLTDSDDRQAVFDVMLHHRPGYPFSLHLGIEYALEEDGGFTVTTTATNVGEEPCPYGAGAHPYLTVGSERVDEDLLSAPGRRWLVTDEQAIPVDSEDVAGSPYDFTHARTIGETQLDTTFTDLDRDADGLARVKLDSPDGRRSVTLWMDRAYPYVMLFTGDSLPQPERRRRSLGIEPMTCAPNALQTGEGLVVLEPGEQVTGRWGVRPRARP